MRHVALHRLRTMATVTLFASALGVLSTAGTAAASPATGSPLVFGQIGTDTGSDGIPQDGQAFEAYIANWNAHGGLHGHPIKIIHIDGALDPSTTTAAAHQLVQSDNVIGMVDDYNFLDCLANNTYYQSSHIAAFGLGQVGCYIPGTDFPAGKTPGSGGLAVISQSAIATGAKTIVLQAPSLFDTIVPVLQDYMKTTSAKLVVPAYTPNFPSAADFDAFLATAKADHAQAVVSLTQAASGQLLLQEAAKQGFGPANGIKYLFGPTEYTPSVASSINGAYVYTYGYPWTVNNSATNAAQKILKGKASVIDGFAQAGYQAAGEFQQVLESIKGPVTRASFLAALEHNTDVTVPLTPGLKVNLAHPQRDAEGGFVVHVVNGKFIPVGGFYEVHYNAS